MWATDSRTKSARFVKFEIKMPQSEVFQILFLLFNIQWCRASQNLGYNLLHNQIILPDQ